MTVPALFVPEGPSARRPTVDVTVARPGKRVRAVAASMTAGGKGIGLATSTLLDLDGPIGVAVQSLVVDKR